MDCSTDFRGLEEYPVPNSRAMGHLSDVAAQFPQLLLVRENPSRRSVGEGVERLRSLLRLPIPAPRTQMLLALLILKHLKTVPTILRTAR